MINYTNVLIILILFSTTASVAQDIDYISNGDFESYESPGNDNDKARFLMQATFGPTRQSINQFNVSYEDWINDQISEPPTLLQPIFKQAKLDVGRDESNLARTRAFLKLGTWNKMVMDAPDQLRQRMAFALSQILVVSDKNPSLEAVPEISAAYNDILARNAFGNFRDILSEVTRSPAMGLYLSHIRNRKQELVDPTTGTTISPDENYAREIMQLFTVGLFERNDDYSLKDGDASTSGIQPIETYDENIITNLSRVFSGLSFQCNAPETVTNDEGTFEISSRDCKPGAGQECEGVHCHFSTNAFTSTPNRAPLTGYFHSDYFEPLICYPRFHDTGRNDNDQPNPVRPDQGPFLNEPYRDKRILGHLPELGQQPLPMKPEGCNALHEISNPTQTQLDQMQVCVDYCDNEIEQALDGLFNHPNVPSFISRQLIQRFITSNPSPSYIFDVSQVFKNNGNGVRGDLAAVIKAILLHPDARGKRFELDLTFGKIKEPIMKLTHAYRLLDFQTTRALYHGLYNFDRVDDEIGQRPYGANSVFNYYLPNYQHPGLIEDADLLSPELQIQTDNNLIAAHNRILDTLCKGYGREQGSGRTDKCDATNDDGDGFGFTLPEVGNFSAYIPTAYIDALPTNFENLVNRMDLWLLNGQMSGTFEPRTGLRGILKTRIDEELSNVSERQRNLLVINLIMASPEFAIQR